MDLSGSWKYIEEVARDRLANNKTSNHISDYGEAIEVLGAAGELAARRFLGLPQKLHRRFDGGTDLEWRDHTVDVKTTRLTPKLNYRYLQWPEGKPVVAEIILMMAVKLREQTATVVGFAYKDEVEAAPINPERDYPCHEISVRELHQPWELFTDLIEKKRAA